MRSLRRCAGEILLGGEQQLRIGVELEKLPAKLCQHVIGHDIERLGDQPRLAHFHAGSGHHEGLAGTDGMGEEGIATAHDAPDGVVLMRRQCDVWAHTWKGEVRAVEAAQPKVVVRLIVEAYESFGAVRIGEDPGAKALFDGFLLVARGQGFLLVEHALFLAIPLEDVIDGRAFQVEGLLQQPDTVGARRAVLRGGGHRPRGGDPGVQAPEGLVREVYDRDVVERGAEQIAPRRPGCPSRGSRARPGGRRYRRAARPRAGRRAGPRHCGHRRLPARSAAASLARTLPERYTSAVCQTWVSGS